MRETAGMDLGGLAVSAAAGALASIGTAAILARANERGRVQEESRQRLLTTVRLYRSHVAMERGAFLRPHGEPDHLGPTERKRFAESVETELLGASRLLKWRVRKQLERLTGPLDARTARWAAPLSVVERDSQARVVYFLERVADEGLGDDQVDDSGLIGAAEKQRATVEKTEALDALVAALKRLERTVTRWRF
jgi:hypothetical protein